MPHSSSSLDSSKLQASELVSIQYICIIHLHNTSAITDLSSSRIIPDSAGLTAPYQVMRLPALTDVGPVASLFR